MKKLKVIDKIMETKYVKVPFEVELAKNITNGNVKGRIVTRRGDEVRIVCWNYKSMSGNYPILALVDNKSQEQAIPYSEEGMYNVYGYLSESCLDLMLEIPEYMTFKDGDIATLGWSREDGSRYCEWITILKNIEVDKYNILTEDYVTVCLKSDAKNFFPIDFYCKSDGADWIRKPTEQEKQKLINALKSSKIPKAKEYLKRFFGTEQKQECEFKPFDKVLVRDYTGTCWIANIFSNQYDIEGEIRYSCCGHAYKYCIPYNDQTAHLLGTTKNWEDKK